MQPLVPVSWFLRLDLVPFAAAYTALLATWYLHADEMVQFVAYLAIPVVAFIHVLFFLL